MKKLLAVLILCLAPSMAFAQASRINLSGLSPSAGTLPVKNGGTGLVAVGTSGLCVLSNGTGLEYGSCGGTAGAGGTDRQMQFNDGTVLAGTAFLTVGTNALSQGLTTFTAKPTFVTVGTTTASINIPVGTQSPSSPVSGDVWITDGMYVQVGTTTQGPLGAGGGVPYTGATTNVDIGTHTMSAASFISTSGTDSSVTFANDMAVDGTASTKLDILAPAGGVLVSVGSTGNVTLGAGQSITLTGGTSGTATFGVAAAAGTGTVFTLPPSNGTAGYVLTTNGSGVSSWASIFSSPATDQTSTGVIRSVTVDANTAGLWSCLLLSADGHYDEAKGNSPSTMPCSALALATGTGTKNVLFDGYARDDSWTWTIGGYIYVSAGTSGVLTQTPPSTSTNIVQKVGLAVSATEIKFSPSLTLVEVP